MEINEKQFLNDEWYNKYSSGLALATIEVLKEKEIVVDEYLDDLIQFSQNPLKANIKNLKNLSKTKNTPGLARMLELVTHLTSRGKKHEYLSLEIIEMNFSTTFGNLNTHLMKSLIQLRPYGEYRPIIA